MADYTVNVEVLRDSIERCIMADRQKTDLNMTPRDLYVKSNPGLLGTDVTNPRDWYCSSTTRKLLRSFVNQYNNVQHEQLTTEAPSKKVSLYVNFPALIKEDGRVVDGQLGLVDTGTSQQLPPSAQHDVLDKNGPSTGRSPHENLTPEDMLSCVGRMKSFMFSLPAVDGPDTDEETSGVPPVTRKGPSAESSVCLPRLSTRTVTFNLDKTRRAKEADPFEEWLTGMPSERQSAQSYLSRKEVDRKARRVKHLETLGVDKQAASRVIPHQYVELLLPRHETELSEAHDFYENYSWRQKSVLNLKLDFGRERRQRSQERHSDSSAAVESDLRPATETKRKPRLRTSPSSHASRSVGGQGEGHRSARGGEILGFFPQSSEPLAAMEVVSMGALSRPSATNPTDISGVALETLQRGDREGSPDRPPPRYVYKVPADGFLQTATKNKKANVVTLGLSTSEPPRRDSSPVRSSPLHQSWSGRTAAENQHGKADEHHSVAHSDQRRKSPRQDVPGGGQVKPRETLRRYKLLEVFGERKHTNSDHRTCADGPPEIVPSETPVRSYKSKTRPPTFKLDERDYSELSKGDTLTMKVKVSNIPRERRSHGSLDGAGSVSEDVQAYLLELPERPYVAESALVIEKLNTERDIKPNTRTNCPEDSL